MRMVGYSRGLPRAASLKSLHECPPTAACFGRCLLEVNRIVVAIWKSAPANFRIRLIPFFSLFYRSSCLRSFWSSLYFQPTCCDIWLFIPCRRFILKNIYYLYTHDPNCYTSYVSVRRQVTFQICKRNVEV